MKKCDFTARIIRRRCGGFLALSAADDSLQIGVAAETEELAVLLLTRAREQWEVLLNSVPDTLE